MRGHRVRALASGSPGLFACAAICVAGVQAACATEPVSARVVGAIRYAGERSGPLLVAAYATFPPEGEPLATLSIEVPVFPQPFELALPVPGPVFVLAVLDASPEDGFRYHSLVDAGGAWPDLFRPAPLAVSAGRDAFAEITLHEPGPGLPSP